MLHTYDRRRNRTRLRNSGCHCVLALSAVALLALQPRSAQALIAGGEGNSPLNDPGWPQGAAAVFNTRFRVAWWEGPPFGGGQWHAECRGDAAALNDVLQQFAKIEAKKRRVVVHDGGGRSFWLNPNRDKGKEADAAIDWVFMVWQPDRWQHLQQMPAGLRPRDGRQDKDDGPVPQIDVFAGGKVKWAEVKVPEGIEVIDERLEAHGFALTDGTVLEGTVVDLTSGAPVEATIHLELIEPQQTGGYKYTIAASAVADRIGKWVLKKAPVGSYRIVVEADGYVSRVLGYGQYDDQPKWYEYRGGLSKPGPVLGRVTDDAGNPLDNVEVRLHHVETEPGGSYESPDSFEALTDRDGRFRLDAVPVGKASVWIHKSGYVRPGLGPQIQMPADEIALTMKLSSKVQVVVDFTATTRPEGYIVEMEPAEGSAIGKWSGSGNVDASGAIAFENVPPGRYVLKGRPNPGNAAEETEPATVELVGGKTTDVVLKAK